jgi:hypothetical protein
VLRVFVFDAARKQFQRIRAGNGISYPPDESSVRASPIMSRSDPQCSAKQNGGE